MRRPLLRPAAINPPRTEGVRLVAAVLRCRLCDAQWQTPVDEWCEPVHVACPECARHRVKAPEAA